MCDNVFTGVQTAPAVVGHSCMPPTVAGMQPTVDRGSEVGPLPFVL